MTGGSARTVLFGVRHHGPGSARSLAAALAELRPDRILIEGPADADPLIPLAASAGMQPPVALLAYREQDPRISAFWPFAAFSPEWSALRYALANGVEVGFCDLPAAAVLALGARRGEGAEGGGADPIGLLAEAAGYEDAEAWWEDVVEHRAFGGEPLAAFAAVAEAMAAVRAHEPAAEYDLLREAHMRTVLRAAVRDGAERIAVVCGAYHVPALAGFGDASGVTPPSQAADRALLAGVPKPVKANAAALTWVPWTHSRLSFFSGYGAGISSPGWYQHLFETGDRVSERWLTSVARLLRDEGIPVSSAHLIEGTRLADTLAALRGRPIPGLRELTEATVAVLCEGRDEPLGLIGRELVVGETLGSVPGDTPTVPLAADLIREAKRLRVPRAATEKQYDLDLRTPNDLDRSKLFRRLGLLGVDWAVDVGARSTGTFRESWRLVWEPVFEVRLVEAAVWGTTVAAAATARALDNAAQSETLGSLTVLVERCLAADLPDAVGPLIELVDQRAALDTDITDLATALPPLANILRYGDVRGTPVDGLTHVVRGIAVRIAIGLPGACVGVDDTAAQSLAPSLSTVHAAVQLLDDPEIRVPWIDALHRVAQLEGAHGLLVGRATRLLRDAGRLDGAAVAARMSLALARGTEPGQAAAWLEGFLAGTGLLLVHDRPMLALIDDWLAGLDTELFDEVLPLLRRTFSTFTGPERRSIGDRLPHLAAPAGPLPSESARQPGPERPAAGWVLAARADAASTVHLLLTATPLEPVR